MHLPPLIHDLAIILGVAAVVTFLFHKIKQPVVLGYLVAGVIVGPYTPPIFSISDTESVKVWAELGVIFLMFSLGLEFTFHKLTRVGSAAAGTALIEVIGMLGVGYGTGQLLGWSAMDSLFLGGILSVSSTTIIIKAFDELGLKKRRFAEIVFGILIVEDLAAILILVGFTTVAATQSVSLDLLWAAGKLVFVVGTWFLVGYFVIPSSLRFAGRFLNNEALTLVSVALCLALVAVAAHYHYSAALGAFIMGSILAETSEGHRIEHLVQPLRDLFAAVFFVSVGMLVDPKVLVTNWLPVLVITSVTIAGKIVVTSVGAIVSGQPVSRAIPMGFSLAQIGEFSFLIAALGTQLKVTSDFLYPIAVAVSVVTTFTTPYLIRFAETAAGGFERKMPDRWRRRLAAYETWLTRPRGDAEVRAERRRAILRFGLCGIVVTAIFLAASRWRTDTVGWGAAVLAAAPFVWGMFTAFGPDSIVSRLVTAVGLGFASSAFFSSGASLLVTFAVAAVAFFFLYRRLESSYHWFERRLLDNMGGSEGNVSDPLSHTLAPWDLGLVRVQIHPASSLVGKTLADAQIRTRFGLNVTGIFRGEKFLAPPTAQTPLYPGDVLLVLGTDTQIETLRVEAEHAAADAVASPPAEEYRLRRLAIEKASPLVGKTLRDSRLREQGEGLVVGLERGTFRTMNPAPETILSDGDVLWLVRGMG